VALPASSLGSCQWPRSSKNVVVLVKFDSRSQCNRSGTTLNRGSMRCEATKIGCHAKNSCMAGTKCAVPLGTAGAMLGIGAMAVPIILCGAPVLVMGNEYQNGRCK
jgi:hypothetical protein